MVWIKDGDSGASVRAKLNTIPNDGTSFDGGNGFTGDGGGSAGDWTATPPDDGASIAINGNASTTGLGGNAEVIGGATTADGLAAGQAQLFGGSSDTGNGGDVYISGGVGGGSRNGLIFLGMGAFAALPTSDPAAGGALWLDVAAGNVLKVSAGAP